MKPGNLACLTTDLFKVAMAAKWVKQYRAGVLSKKALGRIAKESIQPKQVKLLHRFKHVMTEPAAQKAVAGSGMEGVARKAIVRGKIGRSDWNAVVKQHHWYGGRFQNPVRRLTGGVPLHTKRRIMKENPEIFAPIIKNVRGGYVMPRMVPLSRRIERAAFLWKDADNSLLLETLRTPKSVIFPSIISTANRNSFKRFVQTPLKKLMGRIPQPVVARLGGPKVPGRPREIRQPGIVSRGKKYILGDLHPANIFIKGRNKFLIGDPVISPVARTRRLRQGGFL